MRWWTKVCRLWQIHIVYTWGRGGGGGGSLVLNQTASTSSEPFLNSSRNSLVCTPPPMFLGHGICFFPGFKEQIYDVYRYLPPATQVVLISATLPHEILEMTSKFMTDPIRILVKRCVLPARCYLLDGSCSQSISTLSGKFVQIKEVKFSEWQWCWLQCSTERTLLIFCAFCLSHSSAVWKFGHHDQV